MAYCEETDLLLGDLTLGPTVTKSTYIDMAANDMDSRLGYVYTLPITEGDVASHQWSLLKKINAFLASGRLIMAVASAAQDSALNAYGLSLVQEAFADLGLVLDGTLPLNAVQIDGTESQTGPTITQQDDYSAVIQFESLFFRDIGGGAAWQPGPYSTSG